MFWRSGGGKRLYDQVRKKYEIIAFTDNDPRKWGKSIFGIPVYSPESCIKMNFDFIVITSAPGLESIKLQLFENNIKEEQIITSYVEQPLLSRIEFLEKLASFQQVIDKEAEVAEAGVFQGDFAKWINYYYPERRLHLFDTFEGFAEKNVENEELFSQAKVGDYSNTSIELVMGKMPFPKKVIIHKGFFPESAKTINSKFCFVNLDLDLYDPTYEGLLFFSPKMIAGGVILVHDYFADNFKGPREAVDKFIAESKGRYHIYPIGDGISVMVVGFLGF